MKKIIPIFCLSIFTLGFSQKIPSVNKTTFSQEALAEKMQDEEGKSISVKEILEQHKGKILVIDFWASWCKDCILAIPKSNELADKNPNIDFIYFSLERNKEGFDRSLERFNMKQKENYWFSSGWKNPFNDYIELNWIPRFMVIDQSSNIAKYYAISPEDPAIQKTIDQLSK
ncbi:redoxin domain-containing protein [Chryseobacterium sp. POL2]|uniref:TlpA family protein disulfide reductase n=1 Tax=Chryseobacterium sp. POL2 TaxID=2713414 RepID=UPI0013E13F40|nr:thioredoxin family protein [Chryseobacterium sp. POL2]QIG90450.1 redoxin domain-containing protein [Chryseobacterium sp. POL2]